MIIRNSESAGKIALIALLLSAVAACAVSPQDNAFGRAPRVFMVGDSTMADKPVMENPERGWGQLLPRLFRGEVRIENHAVNGRSSKSFREEGRWQTVMNQLTPGDYVVIQFGHNDQKTRDPKRFTLPWGEYRDNLVLYVQEARSRGAIPILATSICRRKYSDAGQWVATHGDYPEVVRQVATELQVPLVDLQAATRQLLVELGPANSKALYLHIAPGVYTALPDGKADDTHLSEEGALRVATLFSQALRRQGHDLADWLVEL